MIRLVVWKRHRNDILYGSLTFVPSLGSSIILKKKVDLKGVDLHIETKGFYYGPDREIRKKTSVVP